ncbi:hypothetical protein [Eleftheria terrae]|uniref:hypothetical protein n=1 Tax=Eleftheria terrae TaxID=1597781 RepID=UPI00263AE6ED|nr:hypothetical protein [Eleftheria terrae]WKB54821.1 hypothetical protein N7L95_10745 [Eleftheria terrae]
MSDTLRLFWNGKLLGSMLNPRPDMFFLYGDWRRECDDALHEALLAALDQDGEVLLQVQGPGKTLQAYLLVEPDDSIEVRLDPGLNAVSGE